MKKIHRALVFVLPTGLTFLSGYFALYIFSGEAGLGAIFLVGFMGIAIIAALISWVVALYGYFR